MNRKSILLATSLAVASLAAAQSARADEPGFGEHGVIISADRLLPIINYDSTKTDNPETGVKSVTDSSVSFAFGSNGAPNPATFYNLPRLGFDVVVVPHLTVGGSVSIYTNLSSNESVTPTNGASTSTDQPKTTYWGFQPRIGYIFPLAGSTLSLWPRAGIAYNNLGSNGVPNNGTTTSSTVWQLGLDLEAMFVITPWTRHFGFTVGPTGDIPLAGKTSTTSTTTNAGNTVTTTSSNNISMWQVGLQAGLVGHF